MVADIASNSDRLRGNRLHVTILFSDIRNFTRLSESMEPEQVVDFLNRFRDRMARVVRCMVKLAESSEPRRCRWFKQRERVSRSRFFVWPEAPCSIDRPAAEQNAIACSPKLESTARWPQHRN